MVQINTISINKCRFNKYDSEGCYQQGLDLFPCENVSIKNSKIIGENCSILIKKSEVSIENTVLKSSRSLIFSILSSILIYNISTNIQEDFIDKQTDTYIKCKKCPKKMEKEVKNNNMRNMSNDLVSELFRQIYFIVVFI
jgi:hypothetical protein